MKPFKLALAMLVLLILMGCAAKQMYSSEGSPPVRKKAVKAKKSVDATPITADALPAVRVIPTEELLKKAKTAAENNDWRQAVGYYTQAQKRVHLSPQLMYNLAMAHSLAGDELLADVWFRAYLATVPEANNADQVRQEIARLEKAAEVKVSRLFQQAEQLAEQLPLQGGESFSKGRRAEAFEQIARAKVEIGDFSGAEGDLAKMRSFAVGRDTSTYLGGDLSKGLFVETLADAGDMEEAISVCEKMKNSVHRDSTRVQILKAAVASKDLKKVIELLDKNYTVDNNYIRYGEIAVLFAQKGDLANAEAFARKETGDWAWGCLKLAEYLLSTDNIQEAVKIAHLSKSPAAAMVIVGEVDKAFQELRAGEQTSLFDPGGIFTSLNDIIKDSIYMGNMVVARRADRLIDEFIEKGVPELSYPDKKLKRIFHDDPEDKKYTMGRAALGKAYLAVENRKVDDGVKWVYGGSHLVNDYRRSEGHISDAQAKTESDRFEWLCRLCEFSVSRGKLDAAERVADSFVESRKRIEYLNQILKVYQKKNDNAHTERLKQKIAALTVEASQGWDQQDPTRETAVNAWADAANGLNKSLAIRDLQAYLSEELKKNPESGPSGLGQAAKDLGAGLIRIRALEKSYR